MKNKTISLLITFMIFITKIAAQVKEVPKNYSTIQSAIDNSIGGDTIIVSPGIYQENIILKKKHLTILSKFFIEKDTSYINNTIIDGNQSGSVISITNNYGNCSNIIGFTIQNGSGFKLSPHHLYGGGIYIDSSKTYLSNLKIIKNNVSNIYMCDGGGIYARGSNIDIINTIISNNSALGNMYANGGGIRVSNCNTKIVNSVISNNSINADYSDGVGIFSKENSKVIILNSSIVNNRAYGGYYARSAIGSQGGDSTEVINSIIWGNISTSKQIYVGTNGHINVSYSNIEDGFNGVNNISMNPKFISPSPGAGIEYNGAIADWSLKPTSSCINNGSEDIPYSIPAVDLNNKSRISDNKIDIGPYEFQLISNGKYQIKDTSITCNSSVFKLPVYVNDSIRKCIGIDISLKYDPNSFSPNSEIILLESLGDTSKISYISNYAETDSILNISIYFNSLSLSDQSINTKGKLFYISFDILNAFNENNIFKILEIRESFNNCTKSYNTSECSVNISAPISYPLSIRYWSNNRGLPNSNTTTYDCTNIFKNDISCNINSNDTIFTNNTGDFTIDNNTNFITIKRDIKGSYNIQSNNVMDFINGNDAFIVHKLLNKSKSITPNVFQIISADVNLDGVISAGDLTMINRRIVLTINEYKQSWNYKSYNYPLNDSISKDWIFIDSVQISDNSNYKISSNYPYDDGIGFSTYRVPNIHDCIELIKNNSNCQSIINNKFYGILLGDVDGNWNSEENNTLKNKKKHDVYIDIANSVLINNNTIEIPVKIDSYNKIINSIDMLIEYNSENLEFKGFKGNLSPLYSTNQINNKILFTSINTYKELNSTEPLLYLKFKLLKNSFKNSDIITSISYINGIKNIIQTYGNLNTSVKDLMYKNSSGFYIYPIPANNILNVNSNINLDTPFSIKILDINGIEKINKPKCMNLEKIDISHLKSGSYIIKITCRNINLTKLFVKKD